MSFWDLVKFNIILLVKQGWRLYSNPSSLMGRILKARYYPSSWFLEARLGSNPSLI